MRGPAALRLRSLPPDTEARLWQRGGGGSSPPGRLLERTEQRHGAPRGRSDSYDLNAELQALYVQLRDGYEDDGSGRITLPWSKLATMTKQRGGALPPYSH